MISLVLIFFFLYIDSQFCVNDSFFSLLESSTGWSWGLSRVLDEFAQLEFPSHIVSLW